MNFLYLKESASLAYQVVKLPFSLTKYIENYINIYKFNVKLYTTTKLCSLMFQIQFFSRNVSTESNHFIELE